jgi:hypothetical protein
MCNVDDGCSYASYIEIIPPFCRTFLTVQLGVQVVEDNDNVSCEPGVDDIWTGVRCAVVVVG